MSEDFVFEIDDRRLPEDWNGVVPTSVLLDECRAIVERADREEFTLRAVGGLAILLHSPDDDLLARLGRNGHGPVAKSSQEFQDLDFVAYRKDRPRLPSFFSGMGYIKRRTTLATAMSERHIYFHPDGWFQVDVFFDSMLMEHTLPLRKRLTLDFPTLSPTDLFLTKIQITRPTRKDLVDLALLMRLHSVSEASSERIDPEYVSRVLARDWGYWYDASRNLVRLARYVEGCRELSPEEKADISTKVSRLSAAVSIHPKSLRWKARSLIGPRLQWYRPVEAE
ncbi:MAG: hypothetical protein ACE5NC_01200 [Anaerolineae bacterium]